MFEESYGTDWTLEDTDKAIRDAYFLSHKGFTEEEIKAKWERFLSTRCVVCGIQNPGFINLYSPTKEFVAKYLLEEKDNHKIIYSRVCETCAMREDFIELVENRLIKIYKETN